jgi:predicted metal-dependent peptidase
VVPGKKREPQRRRVLAVIDTSASIGGTEIRAIGTELLALGTENDVIVVECDCRVHAVYPLAGPITSVKGRGGTDLRPPLATAFLRQHRVDVVVYFTDGFGPAPESAPLVPVLWCLTPVGQRPAPWGAIAHL